jgi:hypothetical protein
MVLFSTSFFKYHKYSLLTCKLSYANPCLFSQSEDKNAILHKEQVETCNSAVQRQWLSYGFWTDRAPATYQQTIALIGHLQRVNLNSAANWSEKHYRRKFLCFIFITLSPIYAGFYIHYCIGISFAACKCNSLYISYAVSQEEWIWLKCSQ